MLCRDRSFMRKSVVHLGTYITGLSWEPRQINVIDALAGLGVAGLGFMAGAAASIAAGVHRPPLRLSRAHWSSVSCVAMRGAVAHHREPVLTGIIAVALAAPFWFCTRAASRWRCDMYWPAMRSLLGRCSAVKLAGHAHGAAACSNLTRKS